LLGYPIGGERRRGVVNEQAARTFPAAARHLRAAVLPLLLTMASFFPALAAAKPSSTPFSIEPGSFEVTPSPRTAGAHPDLTIAFDFAHSADERPLNDVKDTVIDLPPGFAGAASAVPACTDAQLLVTENEEEPKPRCPLDSQLGTITANFAFSATIKPAKMTLPLFNMEHSGPSTPAQLGFRALAFSQLIPMSIRPDGGLTVSIPDVPLFAEPSRVSIDIWGIPASPIHNAQRGQECLPIGILEGEESCLGGGNPSVAAMRPFLDNPTRCGAATAKIEADSWEEPESWSETEAEAGPIVECEKVPFAPSFEARPTSDTAESPTGLDLSIVEPQNRDDPESPASSSLDAAAIVLPEGLSINPPAASGAGTCTPEEFERETAVPPPSGGCPPASELGTVEIETPLLGEIADGSIYMAKPFDDAPGSLPGLYVVARAAASGGFVELTGRLSSEQPGGRLSVSFAHIPQLPLSRLTLNLPQGPDALLVTPPGCGSYDTEAELTPSSDPAAPRHENDSFEIDRAAGGGPCPEGGELPFRPGLSAGTENSAAGAFSSFYLHLAREDGEAQLAGLSLRLPRGLVANLANVPTCPDTALAAASAKTGTEERSDPSCPAGSGIGYMLAGAGVGSRLATVRGSVYLAGPYRGAPLSLAAVTPALLGPFDLGTMVVREGLGLDPKTGAIAVGSPGADPIPQMVDGVPLHLRDLSVYLDRRGFVRNPTGCKPSSIQGTVTGASHLEPVTLPIAYRASACRRLRFAPRIHLRLLGGVHRNGHPGLQVMLSSRRGESGLAGAAIELPRIELLDPGHIRDVCTSERFAERRCPADSAYGFARAFTPFLSEPLKGRLYLRSTKHGLPSLATALNSRELSFDFVARLETVNGGVRLVPESVPDVPISKLVLETRGGKAGLLVNSVDLCVGPRHATAHMTANNGKQGNVSSRLSAPCRRRGRPAAQGPPGP
jgi:hypothetical protein